MKKRSILSILLVFVMIAAVCLFVGCDEEETNAKIDNAVVDAVAQATEKIDAAKAALETAIAAKADTATLTTKIQELNAAIDAAKAAATTADAALKTEIETAIAAAQKAATDAAATNLAAAKTELEAAIAAKADTATLNTKIEEINAAIEAAKKAATDADAALKTEATTAIETATKAVADAAAANLATAKGALEAAIATKADAATLAAKAEELTAAIEAAKKSATDADTAIKEAIAALDKAYVAIGDWNTTTEFVIGLLNDLEVTYAALNDTVKEATFVVYNETIIRLYRAIDTTSAQTAYDFADKTFDAVVAIGEITYNADYYYADEQADIDALIADALEEVLELEFGEDVDAVVTTLESDIEAVETKADIIRAILTAEGDTAADVVLSDAWLAALTEASEKLEAEKALLEGETAWADLVAVVELGETLAQRYTALVQAKADADELNAAIETLTEMLEGEISVITSDYVTLYDAIVDGVATWKTTYFTDFAQEGENWEMLDHDGYDALLVLYDATIGELIELAQAAKEAFDKLSKVTIRSGLDIEEAKATYLAFTNRLGDLEFAIEGVPTSGELATTIARVNAEFIQICKAAIADYADLAEIDTTTVTIYDGEKVAAIIAWYNTYFGVDATVADSTLGIDTLTITDGTTELTFTEDNLVAVKALKAAYDTLAAAKEAETKAVIDAIAALKAAISNREAADAAQAARGAWLRGENAPEGFTAAQFAIDLSDDTYVITNYDELKTIRNTIKTLEAKYADICAMIAKLTKVEDDLVDADERGYYADYVALIEAEIKAFIAANAEEDPFTAEQYATIETAKVEIAQGAEIQKVTDTLYADAITAITGIEDARVTKLLTDRADAALADAIAYIKTIVSTDAADFEVAEDDLLLITYTATEYKGFIADHPYSADQLFTAVELLSNRVVDGMPGDLETEKGFVTETFERAVSDSLLVYSDGSLPVISFDTL